MKTKFLQGLLAVILASGLMSFIATEDELPVDIKSSEIKWTGYHLAKSYEHWGYVTLKNGSITTNGNQITGGEIVIDMNTISNKDIESEKDNAKLVGHLKSEDFFAVSQFPEAKLSIKRTEKKSDNVFATTADLTIKGITKEIQFDTEVNSISADEIKAVADLKIKRTDFNVMYGWSLENAMLDSEFRLQVTIIARK